MGLLRPEDWQAKWIGRDEPEGSQAPDRRLPARYLRTEFTVGKAVRRAMVYYSGLGTSELYLNGAKVGDHVLSPGLTDYDKRALYVTFDVTRQLTAGKNAIGLILGNGRFYAPRAERTRNFGFPKAILRLDIEYQDGSSAAVVSGPEWKLSTQWPDSRQQRIRWRRVRCPPRVRRLGPPRLRRFRVESRAVGRPARRAAGRADGQPSARGAKRSIR